MFGRKQAEIESLRADLVYSRARREEYWKDYRDAAGALEQKTSELSIIQEAFRNGVAVTDGLKARVAELEKQREEFISYREARIETLEYALNESKGLNQALEDENKDLARQVEVLQSVLGQLSVNIKLPARKK